MNAKVFCQTCQAETSHRVEVLRSDVAFHCECGRFVKFPRLPPAELKEALSKHADNVRGNPIAAPNKEKQRPSPNDYLESLGAAGIAT